MRSLAAVPAEIAALAGIAACGEIHLLPGVQADVADHQATGEPVERKTPRVSQSKAPDLVATVRASRGGRERIAGRHRVHARGGTLRIDSKDLPEQVGEILGVAVGIALGSAVPGGDVQIATGPELKLAPVVDLTGRVNGQDFSTAGRVGCIPGGSELIDVKVARLIAGGSGGIDAAVGDVEEMVIFVVRREGHRKQAVVAERVQLVDELPDVEERAGSAFLDELDAPRLLDNEKAVRMIGIRGHERRPVESADLLESERPRARRGGQTRNARREQREQKKC